MRLRQFQLHRDSDRWNRSAGAEPQIGSRTSGIEGGGRRHHGEFPVGLHRRHAVMIDAAAEFVRSQIRTQPHVAIVLGSGLGAFADELTDRVEIPYSQIPGWPPSTAIGHAGKLVVGRLGSMNLAVMAGRNHLYEGYTPAQVTFGVRVLA